MKLSTVGMEIFVCLSLLLCNAYAADDDTKKAGDEDDTKIQSLESIKDFISSTPGDRKIAHCTLRLSRTNCVINITTVTLPCPVLKITEHLFPNVDITKVTGGFINQQISLVNIKFDFEALGSSCNSQQGKVELNMNSTGRHIRIVDNKYLPLKVVLLQANWLLGLEVLRSIDIDINGIFISDNLGGLSNIPRYEGIVVEINKPKELTIFEFKTTKASKPIQLKHFLKDFNTEIDVLLTDLSEKTKSELSLITMMLSEAQLIGYIEPNIMFEFQLTGRHSGSLAYENAKKVYVTVQKYHSQYEPAVAIFGKFSSTNKLHVDLDLLKLSGIDEMPNFNFLKDILSYGLVLSTSKFTVLNIKEAREETNNFYCTECRARYLPGFHLVFNADDDFHFVQSVVANDTASSDKKIIIPQLPANNATKHNKRAGIAHQVASSQTYPNVKKQIPVRKMTKLSNYHRSNVLYNKHNAQSFSAKNYRNSVSSLKRSHVYTLRRHGKHNNSKRVKRDDELKDILNSLNPGNLTINDTVPGAFELDDTFVLDDTKSTDELNNQALNETTNVSSYISNNSSDNSTHDSNSTSSANNSSKNETNKIDSKEATSNKNTSDSKSDNTSSSSLPKDILTTLPPTVSTTTAATTTPKSAPDVDILPPKTDNKIINQIQNDVNKTKAKSSDSVEVAEIMENQKNFKFQSNNDHVVVFVNIQEKGITFLLPQNMEGDIADIKKFVSTSLKSNDKCTPFKNSSVKYNLDRIILTNEKIEIVVNITSPQKLVPNLLTINKFTGLTYTINKGTDGKFDFNNVGLSGEGKQSIMEEEINFSINQDSDSCSVIGQFHLSTIGNITKKFDTELLTPEINKMFPSIDKIRIQKLFLKTSLDGEKTIRLFGTTQLVCGIYLKIEAQLWSVDKERKLALALIASQVELAKFMSIIYEHENVVNSWLMMEKAALFISAGVKPELRFEDELLNQLAVKETGVTFVGKLGHSTNCENHLSNDIFCQYFHTKLAITTGLHIEGALKPDKFTLIGNLVNFITLTKEVVFVEPSLTIGYDEKKVDLFLSGIVMLNIRKEEIKIKGKLSRHGSGFLSLQIASPLNNQIFNISMMQFKPLYGFTHLWNKDEEQLNFELQGSHIGIGIHNSDKLLHIINSAGRVIPANSKESYFYGVIKDLTYPKLLDTFGLSSKVRQIPFLIEARFLGITKVFYSEADKDKKFHFFNELISPGLSLYGNMKISGSIYKVVLRIDETLGMKLNIEFTILNMSKEMVVIRMKKEDESLGAVLTYTIPLNSKQRTVASMKAYVSAVGMEKENVDIRVEQKADSFLYFLFQLKGKLFKQLDMVMSYRGTEKLNEGMKMVGRCPNILSLKKPVENHLRKKIHSFIQVYNEQYKLNEKTLKDVKTLMRDLGTSGEESVRGRLKDLIIQLEEVEQNIKEHLLGIEQDCVERCSKKPIEIQTLQDQSINDGELKTLQIQRITPRWAINVSCVAVCEVDKGVSYKKACEKLIVVRNLYPLYDKQRKRVVKLDRYLQVARKINDVADKANDAFIKESLNAKQIIEKYFEQSIEVTWFELLDIMIPETDVGSLKGKLPCLKMKIKFTLFAEAKEISKDVCINGEVFDNIAQEIFHTMISKNDMKSLINNFDQLKSSYSRVTQHRSELLNVIKISDIDDDVESSSLEILTKRDETFKPLVVNKANKKDEDLHDRRFKKLAYTDIPQYTVHSYKTSVVMNQKSPWAMLKASKNQPRNSPARNQINGTVPEENDCNTVNSVAAKYSHLTNALTDLVEAYEDGKTSFSTARDELVDSLHSLDSKITNEANRTYYTKGELKDMIYWSVRVWKGVEEWVQETTRQFEDHNRNAISLFTEQLDSALSTERIPNAADYIQYLSHIGSSAIRKMDIEPAVPLVKKTETGHKKSEPIKDDFTIKKNKITISEKRAVVPIHRSRHKGKRRMIPESSDYNYILKRSHIPKHLRKSNTRNRGYKKSVIEETDNEIVKKEFNVNDMAGTLFPKKEATDKSSKNPERLVYRQIDHVQNVAIALSTFLRNKDMTLDEAATRIPALRNEVRALESKASTCDAPV